MTNRGSFRNFKLGQIITNWGRDLKSGQRLQIRARGISNRGRDDKSKQNTFSLCTTFSLLYHLLQPKIILSNTSSKNNLRSLRGVSIILRFFLQSYKLQNYSLCESLVNSSQVPESEKTTTTKQINKSLKKHPRDIYWVSHWLGKIRISRSLWSSKGNSKFEILLVKIFSLEQKTKSITSSYYKKNLFFLFSKKTVYGFLFLPECA